MSTIYQEFEREFTGVRVDPEQLYDANFDRPDYETDAYFVPKHRNYCFANFLKRVMNPKVALEEKKLFFDYAPSNALKVELSKKFKLTNKNIYEAYASKNLMSKRKVQPV